MLRKWLAPVILIASLALAGCASSGSGPRTILDPNRDKVEIRIDNYNWLSARVYVATNGSRPRRIASVSTGRTVTKHVNIYSYNFFFVVGLLAGNKTWVGFNTWSSEEECLHLTVGVVLSMTNVVPCRFGRRQP